MNVVRVIIGNEVLLRGDLPLERARELSRPRARGDRPAGGHRRDLARVAGAPGAGAARGFHRRAPAAVLGGRAGRQAVDYSLAQFKRLQKAFPRKPIVIAEIGWPSRGRTRESAVASDANEALFLRRFLHARAEGADRLLRDGGLRSAVEGVHGRCGRLVLGRVRREPQSEVRIHRADRARARVAHPRGDLGGGLAAAARAALPEQRGAAQSRPQLPRAGGVRRRHHRRVGHLRLHAAVHDRLERRSPACCCCSACSVCCWCCSPRRTSGPRPTG